MGYKGGPDFSKFDTESKEEKVAAYHKFLVVQRTRDMISDFLRPIIKSVLILACAALLFGIVVLLSGIPKSIDKQYSAVQFRVNDETYLEHTKITIKGKLYNRLFAEPHFSGSFVIDNVEYTKTYMLFDIRISGTVGEGSGLLFYHINKNGSPVQESVGPIWIIDRFGKLTIMVFEPYGGNGKSTTDLVISAPAKSREEAMQIYQQLIH